MSNSTFEFYVIASYDQHGLEKIYKLFGNRQEAVDSLFKLPTAILREAKVMSLDDYLIEYARHWKQIGATELAAKF